MDLLQREHPEILAGREGVRVWKSDFRRRPTNALISLKRDKIKITIENQCAFSWCQNQRPWMTLKGMQSVCTLFENMHRASIILYLLTVSTEVQTHTYDVL